MQQNHIKNIRSLLDISGFESNAEIIPLPVSGSNRIYFRVIFSKVSETKSVLASYNSDVSENIAHNSFTVHFRSLGLRVPEIYARDDSYHYFIIQDLGDTTLFDLLEKDRQKALNLYKNVITDLLNFQLKGIQNLDLDVAYPVKSFDRRSVMWDLNYFKYYFIKPHDISFNENLLESDFEVFADSLLNSNRNYFNYRDLQARNIMYHDNELWYIDFQGGRKGPLQYDLVSLLNQVKAKLSEDNKHELHDHYLTELENRLPGSQIEFEKYYADFEYFRLMQVMGAYGFRGKIQRKAHFLQSIAPSISSLKELMEKSPFSSNMKELRNVFNQIIEISDYKETETNDELTIAVNSFSYKKKGIPIDTTGNGGGHVFDCRSLPNPGRIANLRDFTGLDKEIINYLKDKPEMKVFISSATEIIDQSVSNYLERGFNNLQINFGCTGGRHRSVFSASTLGKYLKNKYPSANVIINHNELD